MMNPWAALLLACACAFGQPADKDFGEKLRAARDAGPEAVFALEGPFPEKFAKELEKAGHPRNKLSNQTAWLLFERTQRAPIKTPALVAQAADAEEPPPPPGKPVKRKRGLDILGIELGGGVDQVKNDVEPYLSKSEHGPLDWDIRARVALDGLGARAKYRNPEGLRAFSVGFLKYWDFPAALGADKARDDVYKLLGQTPDKPQGGFELNISGAINAYMGGATTYDRRQGQKGDRYTDQQSIGLTAGYSPLGDNPGKRWNYTLLAGGSHEKKLVDSPVYKMDAEGLGWMTGVAFQLALHDVPIPGKPVDHEKGRRAEGGKEEEKKKPFVYFDRLRTKLAVSDSAVTTLAVEASASVSVLLASHLELTGGLKTTFRPSPNRADPEEDDVFALGGIVGLDLRY
jgi:hypothetical protein